PDWVPLTYVKRAYSQASLAGLYRLARIGLVTPLRDGMNLVAHEYIAAQDPEDPGVLVLARFAGAAEIFHDALQVNPFDTDETAEAIRTGLTMPLDERKARWQSLMQAARHYTVDAWADSFLDALNAIRPEPGEDEADGGDPADPEPAGENTSPPWPRGAAARESASPTRFVFPPRLRIILP